MITQTDINKLHIVMIFHLNTHLNIKQPVRKCTIHEKNNYLHISKVNNTERIRVGIAKINYEENI